MRQITLHSHKHFDGAPKVSPGLSFVQLLILIPLAYLLSHGSTCALIDIVR